MRRIARFGLIVALLLLAGAQGKGAQAAPGLRAAAATTSSFFDDFSPAPVGSPPPGWSLFGSATFTPIIVEADGSGSAFHVFDFPAVSWQYWDKFAVRGAPTTGPTYRVQVKLRFFDKVADRAGIVIAFNRDTIQSIMIQPNVYNSEIEFRSSFGGTINSIAGTGAIDPGHTYWLRADVDNTSAGSGVVDVYWSTDGGAFTQILHVTGLTNVSGEVGVVTSGPNMPHVQFDDFALTEAPTCRPLTTSHTGQGADPVTNPTHSPTCTQGNYVPGEVVSLTAAPAPGWTVLGWTGTANNSLTTLTNQQIMPERAEAVSVLYGQLPPDLHPLQCDGCEFMVVPSSVQGTVQTGTLRAGQTTYFDWGVSAENSAANSNSYYVDLYVDSARVIHDLIPANYALLQSWDDAVGGITAGPHTVRLVVDPDNFVAESDEANNTWQRVFTWAEPQALCYALTPTHTGQGSDPVATPANSTGCPAGQYVAGASIMLGASPAAGWVVGGWSGTANNNSTSTSNTLAMPAAPRTVGVVYGAAPVQTGDSYEADNQCKDAKALAGDGVPQAHTFHTAADNDWLRLAVTAGVTYRIEATVPTGSLADVTLDLHAACATLPQSQNPSFAPGVRIEFKATTTGAIYLNAYNINAATAGANVRYEISARPQNTDTTGAAIIVAGRLKTSDSLQANIHHVASNAYSLFVGNGYAAGDIYVMAADPSLPGYKAPAARDNLRLAITSWAAGRVDANHPLTLFLVDHGDSDRFYLDKPRGEEVTTAELDGWLNQLQAARPGVKINIVIEACYSGSFVAQPGSLSRPGRMVITSTSATLLAYGSQSGAYFSDAFITSLRQGRTAYESWHVASMAVQRDIVLQEPWLDADGDGNPNQAADFALAAQRGFGIAGTFADLWPPYIAEAAPPAAIDAGHGAMTATVRDNLAVGHVWAVVYPPSYTPPTSQPELVAENLDVILLQGVGGDLYRGNYSGFTENGVYTLVLFADDADGLVASPVELRVQAGWTSYLPAVFQ